MGELRHININQFLVEQNTLLPVISVIFANRGFRGKRHERAELRTSLAINFEFPDSAPGTIHNVIFQEENRRKLVQETRQQQSGEMHTTRRVSLACVGHGAIKADTSTPPSCLVRHQRLKVFRG